MQSLRFTTVTLASTLVLSLATASFGDTSPAGKERARKSGWHTSFSEAQAEAQALGKPLLVHFYADWCAPCKQMEHSVLNQPAVLRCLGEEVVGVKVNADHHPDIKSKFGVSGFPTDVLVSPTGQVSTRYVGISTETSFIDRLKREGAKYSSSRSETQLAKQSQAKPKTPKPAIAKKPGEHLGLEGYSPVALTTGKLWKKGLPEYTAQHQGVTYRFMNEDELELFQANPAKYAPRVLGCDPVILSDSGRAVRGKTGHGVFFRDGVYLMATDANRTEFLKNPAFYADKRFAVEVEEIERYATR